VNRIMLLSIIVGSLTLFAFTLLSLNILWVNVGEDGDIANVAILLASNHVFSAFSALISGFLVDRLQKKQAIVVCLLACAALAMAWLLAEKFLAVAVVVYLAINFASDLYADTFTALVAEKLSAANYVKLDAIELVTGSAVSIGSSLVSAVLLMQLSQQHVILLVTAILVASAIICYKLLPESAVESVESNEDTDVYRTGIGATIRSAWDFARENVLTDKRIMLYAAVLFVLNLDYAFIPTALPFLIMSLNETTSLVLVVIMQSGNELGEFLAASVIIKYGHYVSLLTKIGLIGSALVFTVLPLVYTFPIAATVLFVLYGAFDTLTQPYYSHFVSSLDHAKRGRILGIVSFMVLLASPLGIILGNWLSSYGMVALSMGIVTVFLFSVIVLSASKDFGSIVLAPGALDEDEDGDD